MQSRARSLGRAREARKAVVNDGGEVKRVEQQQERAEVPVEPQSAYEHRDHRNERAEESDDGDEQGGARGRVNVGRKAEDDPREPKRDERVENERAK